MGAAFNGFHVKKPPDSYTGTNDQWKALSQSQRKRVRNGPVIREKERAYRARPDIKADIKEYRSRPEIKAAAALRSKARRIEIQTAEMARNSGGTTTYEDASHQPEMQSILIETTDDVHQTCVAVEVEM